MNYSTGVAVTSGLLLFARLLAKYPAHTHTHTQTRAPLDATFNIYFQPLISAHIHVYVWMTDCLPACPICPCELVIYKYIPTYFDSAPCVPTSHRAK